MKRIFLLALISLCLSALTHAQQPGLRTFDNFDRSQGVQVYSPAAPMLMSSVAKKGKRGRGAKYQVVVQDKLVQKTAMSARTASVTDGLAQRDALTTFSGGKLAMGPSSGLKGFTTGNELHDSYIVESSRKYNIDPLLIYSQMHQESSFHIRATSNKGASGLMQLMPATARRFGVTSIYDPKQNIDAGIRYMRWLLDTFNGDVVLALAGYNAGEGAVMKYGWNVPPYRETQEYVRRITSRYSSITDGRYVHTARPIGSQSARLIQKESRPLAVYEPGVLPVRTADGKMMLMNQ
ncbi:MAG TPA: lytic transglycosylase domain-containing protein [Pyrinomonadaceae bacterium]|nr:lytic transglycosylase domain-containing protein [Pyrinomonadaceae bacterium]